MAKNKDKYTRINMLKYLPRPDLPPVMWRAFTEQDYAREMSEFYEGLPKEQRALKSFSTTTLPRAPRQVVLFSRHSHKIAVDPVKSNFWKFFGSLVHLLLERRSGQTDIAERRFAEVLDGFKGKKKYLLVGKPDVYHPEENVIMSEQDVLARVAARTLMDYKVTSTYAIMSGEKFEHHAQGNINRWLLEKAGMKVDHIRNLMIFRDWRANLVKDGSNYPKEQVMLVDIPMWSREKTEAYIRERIQIHADAENTLDDKLAFCTDEERWVSEALHKAIKIDPKTGELQKVSKFKSNSLLEVQEWIDGNGIDLKGNEVKYEIVTVPGAPKRCAYCEIASFCNQRVAEVSAMGEQPTEEE